jgi:pimeloyl-ACP methyl ester carboxylesterase
MKDWRYFLKVKSVGLYINILSYICPQKARDFSYKLFSSPKAGKLRPEQLPEILKKAHRGILSGSNGEIQTYLWDGSQDRVLLVHGWESNAARWEPLLSHLKQHDSKVLALDAPAHGLSAGEFNILEYAKAVDAVVRDFDPKYIIGHSLGGMILTYYLHQYQPKNVDKVVFLGSPSDFEVMTNNYTNLLSLSDRSKSLFESYFTKVLRVDPKKFTARIFGNSIHLPALVAHDEQDDVVKYEESGKIVSSWKAAQHYTTRNLGHSMHDDALYLQILEFLFGKKQLI